MIDWLGLANGLTLGVIPALSKKVESRHQAVLAEGDVTFRLFARATDIPAELLHHPGDPEATFRAKVFAAPV